MTVVDVRVIAARKHGTLSKRMLSWVAEHVVLVSLAILFVAPVVFVG